MHLLYTARVYLSQGAPKVNSAVVAAVAMAMRKVRAERKNNELSC